MLPKAVVVLACFCVVKAAVFTVNAYDGSNDIEAEEDTLVRTGRSCVNSQCNRFCRRRGYLMGACVRPDVCRCRGRPRDESGDDNTEGENPSSDDVQSAFLDAINPEIENSSDDESGDFVDINPEEHQNDEESLVRSRRICIRAECNASCLKMGYARGVCVGLYYCECQRAMAYNDEPGAESPTDEEIRSSFLAAISPETSNPSDDDSMETSVRSCSTYQCTIFCRRIGFAYGGCIGPNVCRCSGRRNSADETPESDTLLDDDVDSLAGSFPRCNHTRCSSFCQSLGFARGTCVGTRLCRCRGRRNVTGDAESSFQDNFDPASGYLFDDDVEALGGPVRRCNHTRCNDFCRSLGFARGTCVGTRLCRCRGRRNVTGDGESSFQDNFDPEAESQLNDYADPLDSSVRGCQDGQCNLLCRRRGYKRGRCVNRNVCRCYGKRMASDNEEEFSSLDNVQPESDDLLEDDVVTLDRSVRACNNAQCNSLCRRLGFARGVCVSANVCRCSGRRMASDDEEPSSFDNVEPETNSLLHEEADTLDRSVRSCNRARCHSLCRRLGFARGRCVSPNVCRCTGRRMASEDEEPGSFNNVQPETNSLLHEKADTLDRSVRACISTWCNSICRRRGFAGGRCVGNVCRCSGPRMASDDEESSYLDNVEPETNSLLHEEADTLDRSASACNNARCNSGCRRVGFAGGRCVGNACRCIRRRSAGDETPEENEVADRRACNLRWCEQTCRRMGFPGGACVNGRCKCDIRRADELPSFLTPETNSENNEEADVRACNLRWCEQNCRRMGFPGGVCVNGRCKCDIRRADELPSFFAPETNSDVNAEEENSGSVLEEETNEIPQN